MIDLLQKPSYFNALTSIKFLTSVDVIPTVFTTVANFILFLAIAKTRSLHTPSNMLLATLCFSDLLIGAVSQPLFLAFLFKIQSFQIPSNMLNKVVQVSSTIFNGLSFIIVLYITIDRYVAVCYPFFYQQKVSIKSYSIIMITTILYQCLVPIASPSLYFFLYTVVTILSFAIMFFCYIKICSVIAQKERSILRLGRIGDEERQILHRNREDRSKTYTIMVLLIVFTITYLPSLIIILVIFKPGQSSSLCQMSPNMLAAFMWSTSIYALSGAINPIAYCIRMKSIKKAAIELIRKRSNRVLTT